MYHVNNQKDRSLNIKDILRKSDRSFLRDARLNMCAFAIYIAAQQIILLPILAKLLDDTSYASIIIFISLMNVFCNVLGGQIGVTRQLRSHWYCDKNIEHIDFNVLMLYASCFVTLIMPIVLIILKYSFLSILFLLLITLISNYRLYIRFMFRMNSDYGKIIKQNLLYLVGIIVGLLFVKPTQIAWIPLFLGELAAIIYTLSIIPKKIPIFHKSAEFKGTITRYLGLGSADALTNAVTLVDKLLVYPLLGSYSLAVYNAGSAMGKITSLIMNPLNEVILVYLSKASDRGAPKLFFAIIKLSFLLCMILSAIMLPVIYLMSLLLYHQYIQDITTILIFLSLASSIGTVTSILKNFILKYAKPKQLTLCYAVNLVLLAIGGSLGAIFYGLVGFSFAVVCVRALLWLSFIWVLFICMRKEQVRE